MKMGTISTLFLSIILFANFAFSRVENGNSDFTGLGFLLGTEKDDAVKIIKSDRREILENSVDSKEIRTIVVEGAFVELPFNINNTDLKTRLEFYDDKLMSSSLILKPNDESDQAKLGADLTGLLISLYGEPGRKEEMLQFVTWTWQRSDVTVILSANLENGMMKVENIYVPVNQARKDEEFEDSQKEKSNPAKEMFLDGTYSKPTQYRR
ncbi:MAG TPA: hypothetical protein VLB01_00445 [Thermodesulfobacteriota bacterium]|nr:hypothetical protein [Thermodesulfobacteriota bacterium]